MNIQELLNQIQKESFIERSNSQMTLRGLIDILSLLSEDDLIQGFRYVCSYRGYYSDLCLVPQNERMSVLKALEILYAALGSTQVGWKGGEFIMSNNTPVWYAAEGCCGMKIIDVDLDGNFVLEEDED